VTFAAFSGEQWLPHFAREVLQAVHFMHRHSYVHKDLHPGNIFIGWTRDRVNPAKEPIFNFKVGDLGISRLETDINVFGTMLAQWMRPPESYDPGQFGFIDRRVDIYHVGLLLLSLVLGHSPTFTPAEIVTGAPRDMAEGLPSVYGPVIAKALRRHVAQRTPTASAFVEGAPGRGSTGVDPVKSEATESAPGAPSPQRIPHAQAALERW